MKIKEKIQAMSAKQIIMAMVAGLQNPRTKIDMDTYGIIRDDLCYGCAATNTICEIADIDPIDYLCTGNHGFSNGNLDTDVDENIFIDHFELAIDQLRTGDLNGYNNKALKICIAPIKNPIELPALFDDYTTQDLEAYIKLAELQG